MKLLPFFLTILFNLFLPSVFAHEEDLKVEKEVPASLRLEEIIATTSTNLVVSAFLIIAFFIIVTVLIKEKSETVKKILFAGIAIPVIVVTLYLIISTVSLNLRSVSGGPVHWHADFEIWNCGEKVDLIDPSGFSNKVGTSTFHEHNDNRIHVEGVVIDRSNASLGKFFNFIGGNLTRDLLQIPTTKEILSLHDGDLCPNGSAGSLQVFLYATKNGTFTQTKLKDPQEYIISPYGSIPPGDCVIIEFDPVVKEKTDKLCSSYKLQLEKMEINHGP